MVNVELAMDRLVSNELVSFLHLEGASPDTYFSYLKVNLPRGYGYIEFKKKADAEKALLYMNGVCILPYI